MNTSELCSFRFSDILQLFSGFCPLYLSKMENRFLAKTYISYLRFWACACTPKSVGLVFGLVTLTAARDEIQFKVNLRFRDNEQSISVCGYTWKLGCSLTIFYHVGQGFPTFFPSRTTWAPRIVNSYHLFQKK